MPSSKVSGRRPEARYQNYGENFTEGRAQQGLLSLRDLLSINPFFKLALHHLVRGSRVSVARSRRLRERISGIKEVFG